MNEIIKRLIRNPKTLFLVDSLGALVTALILFAILKNCYNYFGMPQTLLAYLSMIAVVFCLYSMSCFILVKDNWQPFLRVISYANLLYCCLTLSLLVYYYQSITIFDVTYFIAEIISVCGLVFIELKAVRKSD